MSFSLDMKQELLDNKPMRARCKMALAYGLFLFGRAFEEGEISLHTENQETVRLFQWFAGSFLGKRTALGLGEKRRSGGVVYMVGLAAAEDRRRLLHFFGHRQGEINRTLLEKPEYIGAFLAGAYLACGNMADPEKSYHLEFVVRSETLCREFAALLEEAVPGARVSSRRGNHLVYYKECGPIEDLLTLMGATKSCLAVIDIEMVKSIRNRANRAVNCETANIDKQVGAADKQAEDIRLVLDTVGEQNLPTPLLVIARLRLQHPDASLRELSELSPEPLTRGGVHHRLERLGKMAAEIRNGKGEPEHG